MKSIIATTLLSFIIFAAWPCHSATYLDANPRRDIDLFERLPPVFNRIPSNCNHAQQIQLQQCKSAMRYQITFGESLMAYDFAAVHVNKNICKFKTTDTYESVMNYIYLNPNLKSLFHELVNTYQNNAANIRNKKIWCKDMYRMYGPRAASPNIRFYR